jgi:hypothetical protein
MADDVDSQAPDRREHAPETASGPPRETVRFGLDGIVHEVDLDPADARDLRAVLAPYVAAGRRTTVTITPITPPEPAAASGTARRHRGARRSARLARGERPPHRHPRPHLRDPHDDLPRARRALIRPLHPTRRRRRAASRCPTTTACRQHGPHER